MKDIITVSTVTINAAWGNKEVNLNRILGYADAAGKKGADLIIFPEMALTGYDDEVDKPKAEKMQVKLAELIPGPSSQALADICKQYGMYAVMGMPERDADDASIIYNSLAICTPEGSIGTYRKMHLPYPDFNWATSGDQPVMFDTPWGPMGVSICYDTYCFPELMRYYAAKGARLHINSTAIARCHGKQLGTVSLEAQCLINQMYIASSNLGGKDLYNEFWGGSSIIGPSQNFWETFYYSGYPFTHPQAVESEMFTTTIDLSLAKRGQFKNNPAIGQPDFRADVYIKMYQDALEDDHFGQ